MEAEGLSVRLVSFHTVKPLDELLLQESFGRGRLVVTLEEHSVVGGLGGAVAEWLADQAPLPARLLRIGTPDRFWHETGGQSHARLRLGLDPEAVTRRIVAVLPLEQLVRMNATCARRVSPCQVARSIPWARRHRRGTLSICCLDENPATREGRPTR